MLRYSLLLLYILSFGQVASGAILIDEGKAKQRSAQVAPDGLSLRKVRRAAIGMTAAGPLGFVGGNLELNFTPRTGFGIGFGGSTGYQAYTFQIKRVLAGEWLLPYMVGGYSRWYTTRDEPGKLNETNPTFLAERFLSDREKQLGRFSKHIIYPGFGLQYMQLSGSWAGYSMFTEIVMLLEIESFEAVPTGTLGFLYYF